MMYPRLAQAQGRPEMGKAARHGIAGEVIDHLGIHSEADRAAILYYFLSAYSVMLGRNCVVRVGPKLHPLAIWTLILGRTGNGRKGTAVATVDELLYAIDAEFMGYNINQDLTSAAGLIVEMQDPVLQPGTKLKAGGREDKRLLICVEEYVSLLTNGDPKLAPTLRTAWDGNTLRRMTAKDGLATVTRPHFAVHGHATIVEFAAKMSRTQLAGGTFNRTLIGYADMYQIVANPRYDARHDAGIAKLAKTLSDNVAKAGLLGNESQPYVIQFTAAAEKYYEELYARYVQQAADASTVVEQFTSRQAPHAKRVAGVYALMNGRKNITVDDLRAAEAVVAYSLDTVDYIADRFADVRDDSAQREPQHITDIREALKAGAHDGVSQTAMSDEVLQKNYSGKEVTAILSGLGVVSVKITNPDTGRKRLTHFLPEFAPGAIPAQRS